jgi:hypothetical protein
VSNPGIFNGTTGLLAPGQELTIQLRVEIDASSSMIPDSLWNRATAIGDASRSNGVVYTIPGTNTPISTLDNSDAGTNHESTNPTEPEDKGTAQDNTLIEVLGTVGDFVWNDLNGNGIQDIGEPGLPNIPVILYDCSTNTPIRNTITGLNGKFLFEKLIRGSYRLFFDISSLGINYSFSDKMQGTNTTLDSDVNLNGFTDCFIVNAGISDTTKDAGIVLLGAIGDFVWHDVNGNGQQDIFSSILPAQQGNLINMVEPGIPGVQVNLFRANGAFVATAFTDANGKYLFEYVRPGNLYVQFKTPSGFERTYMNRGNDGTDSDMDGANGPGTTSTIFLSPGVTDLTIDAGFYKCVPIGDLVWYDINKNDVWDNNENGINGLKVNLWRNNFGVWTIVDFKYTGQKPGSPSDDGYFMFCAPPGEYYIEVVMPPLGLVRSRPNIGTNEENDSDITSNGKTEVFIALSGSTKMDIGAGFYPMAVAGNLVWRDDNINGRQEANEPRVKGVKVEAIEMITGKVAGTAYTDDQGLYSLDYLEKEQYYIKFTPPAGFGATVPRAYSDDLDSDVDHSYGPYTTRAFSFESGMVNENIDLGLAYGVLPVDWLDVNVHRVSNKHIISWSTAREANVSHYEVERKLDGEKDFNPIPGIVAAKGNSNQISSYNHPDLDVDKPGSYVYRVKQIDFDGLFAYSKLVKVVVSAENSIEIYPNPAKNETNIQVSVSSDATVMIELFDGISKLVRVLKKSDVQVTGSVIYNMNLSDIPAGVYNVAITVDGVTTQKKLIRIE